MSSATFQEYSTADANVAVKVPDHVSFTQAATISVTWFTAIVGLCHSTTLALRWPGRPFPKGSPPPESNEPILVWGAGSGIGRAAVQILNQAGYTNILATASASRFEDVKSVGAKAVFNYRDADVVEQILKYTANDGQSVRIAFDPISTPDSLNPLSRILPSGGKVGPPVRMELDVVIHTLTSGTIAGGNGDSSRSRHHTFRRRSYPEETNIPCYRN